MTTTPRTLVPVLALACLFLVAALPSLAQAPDPAEGLLPPPTPVTEDGGPPPWELTLRDAVARALRENLDIQVARIDPASARESVTYQDAVFEPELQGSGSWDRQTEEPSSRDLPVSRTDKQLRATWVDPLRTGGQVEAGVFYREMVSNYPPGSDIFGLVPATMVAGVQITVRQPLLRNYGLRINRTAIEQAKNSLGISEEQLRQRVMEVVEQVESAYWKLLGARRQLDVARASYKLAQDFLKDTRVKVEVGTLPEIEITTAEAEVADRDGNVIVAENAVRNAEDNLRVLLHVPQDSAEWERPIVPVDRPVTDKVDVDLDEAIREALAHRPEVKVAELQLRNRELDARWRKNQVRPDLSLVGTWRATGNNYDYYPLIVPGPGGVPQEVWVRKDQGRTDAFSEIPDRDNSDWSIGFNLRLPIRNRRARADLARARLASEQARLQVQKTRLQVRVEVRQAVRDVESAFRRMASARANVVLQRKKMEAEQKRFENGLSTAFKVLQFQTDLRDAESRLINAAVDYNQALVRLLRVRGVLLEQRGIEVPAPAEVGVTAGR